MSCDNRRAPHNSSRGIVSFFRGATFVLDDTRDMRVVPLSCWIRKYTTAEYAFSDASENPCSSLVDTWESFLKKQRGICMLDKRGSSILQRDHNSWTSSGTGSSQHSLSSHNLWNCIFIFTVHGESHPNTSKILLTSEISKRLVT